MCEIPTINAQMRYERFVLPKRRVQLSIVSPSNYIGLVSLLEVEMGEVHEFTLVLVCKNVLHFIDNCMYVGHSCKWALFECKHVPRSLCDCI